tara:strand:- start:799 stop:1194 length:396 start_codon:yes stop_codon:yes gene_type:complete
MSDDKTTQSNRWGWLALFASLGTLLCCALPILLVALGFGAVVATITYQLPWIVTLAEQKLWMFGISGGILVMCAWLIWRQRNICPADPALATRCQLSKRWNNRFFWTALIIWSIGFSSAFLLYPLRNWIYG